MGTRAAFRLGLTVAVCLVFLAAGLEALSFARLARYLPLYVSVAGLSFGLYCLAGDLRRLRRADGSADWTNPEGDDEFPDAGGARIRRQLYYLAWFLGFAGAIWLVGMLPATALFTLAFLRREACLPWISAALGAAGGVALLVGVSWLFGLDWPRTLISQLG